MQEDNVVDIDEHEIYMDSLLPEPDVMGRMFEQICTKYCDLSVMCGRVEKGNRSKYSRRPCIIEN